LSPAEQPRTAIVTGGGRGIGRATTLTLARGGTRVAVVYRSDQEAAASSVADAAAAGAEAFAIKGDVTDAASVTTIVDAVLARWGRVDVLVNNAGVATQMGTNDVDGDLWADTIAGNLTSTFLCAARVIPVMQEQCHGRIVNVASQAGRTGGRTGPHYAAAKGGVIALTSYLAREQAPYGITVNAVAPNYTETETLVRLGVAARREEFAGALPMGRFARPEEVAAVIAFLASPEAAYVSGECVGITGAM
jgi:NAD(P)-dependent dehydrogenase (short-subunit alcohol dehydrogenase family)